MRKLFCIAALCAALCFTTACGSESAAPNGGGTAAPGPLSGTGEEAPDTLRLSMTQETWSVTDPELTYTVINETGETQEVVLIPHLERRSEDQTQEEQWEEIACTTGFCGNPDSVESQFNGSILTEWYPDLTAGAYRLSFHVGSPDSDDAISAQFALE